MIFLIKDFDIHDSDFLEFEIYVLNINTLNTDIWNWHEGNLKRQPVILDPTERDHFRRIKLDHFLNFELHCISKIDGSLSRQKAYEANIEVKLIFQT